MKILIIGTGPLGSLFAGRLDEAGHEVSLLARGARLAQLREHGLVLEDSQTGEVTTAHPRILETLDPAEPFDLALVIMRKNHVAGALSILAQNPHIPSVVIMGNNAAGPGAYIQALGAARVLTGFPSSAGYFKDEKVVYLGGSEKRQISIPIGEVDGVTRSRTRLVASVLSTMRGYTVEILPNMDAWHKTHVALLMPSIAPALFAAGLDRERLANTPDLIVLMCRAIREGFAVLQDLGVPIVPHTFRVLAALPEPLLVLFVRRLIARPQMEVALVGHARAARDELIYLADEFLTLAAESSVPIPSILRLVPYMRQDLTPVPAGSAEIPLDWQGVYRGVLVLGTAAVAVSAARLLISHGRCKC
jgi:2-dehydropantoate 2-reductase